MSRAAATLLRVGGQLPAVVTALEAAELNLQAKLASGIGSNERREHCERDARHLGERFGPALERAVSEKKIAAADLIALDQILQRTIVALWELVASFALSEDKRIHDMARLASVLEMEIQPAVHSLHTGYAVGQEVPLSC